MEIKITEKIAIISASAFVLTVVYVYGFSLAIDVDLFNYFSISDYIKFSVCWLPYYLIGPVIGFLCAKFEDRVLKPRTTKEVIQSSNTSTFYKLIAKALQYDNSIILGLLILTSVSTFITSFFKHVDIITLYGSGTFLVAALWILLTSLYLRESSIVKEKWPFWQQKTLLWGPVFICSVFFVGLIAGDRKLDSLEKFPTANLEMITEAPNKEGSVLFALSQYIVFLEQKTKTVEIIPINQVKDIILIPEDKSKKEKKKKQ